VSHKYTLRLMIEKK